MGDSLSHLDDLLVNRDKNIKMLRVHFNSTRVIAFDSNVSNATRKVPKKESLKLSIAFKREIFMLLLAMIAREQNVSTQRILPY